jgi:hypothetical protein
MPVGLRTEPALIVRGSSRRITIMRFRHANIRVINRRETYLDHDLRCLLRRSSNRIEELLPWNVVDKLDQLQQVTDWLLKACA